VNAECRHFLRPTRRSSFFFIESGCIIFQEPGHRQVLVTVPPWVGSAERHIGDVGV